MDDRIYKFVDVTGKCFESFRKTENCEECFDNHNCNDCSLRKYNDTIGNWLQRGKLFSVGDMMVFKQDLLDAGFKWSIDFYVRKIDDLESEELE